MNPQTVNIILQIATILYILSMTGYMLFLFNQKKIYQKTAFHLIIAAIAIHFISILMNTIISSYLPIQNLSQNLSVAALILGGMFLFFQYRFNLKILGLFASILITLIMVIVVLLPDSPVEKNNVLKGFWIYSHIILVFAGEAALALACGTGILYLLQEKGIKTKNPGFFFKRLPSLDLLDSVGYTCMTAGFALVTIGLVTGFIYAKIFWGQIWSGDAKEVFSVITWLVYAALLHLRLYSGWRGRKSAIMTIMGFVIIVFTFLGVNLLIGGHHQDFTK